MRHSDAVVAMVKRLLSVMGCSVRILDLVITAKGKPVIFSLSGCLKYPKPLNVAEKKVSITSVMIRLVFFLGLRIFTHKKVSRMSQSERLNMM